MDVEAEAAKARAAVALHVQRAGVSALDADRLVEAAVSDPVLVLVIAPIPGLLRVGDRVNTRARSGNATLRVEDCAKGEGNKWAIVGLPVESSSADDGSLTSPVVRRTL